MSLNFNNASLTSTAKASGKRVVVKVIVDLDTGRNEWLSAVVIAESLLGTHDTVRTKWVPIEEKYRVTITGSQVKSKVTSVSLVSMTNS